MRTDHLRLLEAIEQIETDFQVFEQGRDAFFSDPLIQSAVLHRLALLGEPCRGSQGAGQRINPGFLGSTAGHPQSAATAHMR